MPTIQKILNTLKTIPLPGQDADIVTLGQVRDVQADGQTVSFALVATAHSPAVEEEARRKLLALDGCCRVEIRGIQPEARRPGKGAVLDGLSGVKHIIAVSSCKGGVGKSTVAAHLARELGRRGFATGLADADIHGPSLPALFQIGRPELRPDERNRIPPVEKHGIKLMSFGFLLGDAPAVMRGPIVTRYIQQLLLNTAWGRLDYLLIDMPPGTGDVHLTITQSARLSGAVIVTTPHSLSLIDVARGILMFEKVNVPILGIIENMAYFTAPESGTRHYIFGHSTAGDLAARFGVDILAEIPVSPEFGQIGSTAPVNPGIKDAADKIVEAVTAQERRQEPPAASFDETDIRLDWPGGESWTVNNRRLRLNSQDALSVDEMTGQRLLRERDIRADIMPVSVTPLGNYALNVAWNDGHNAGIYTYRLIESLARKTRAGR
jgi:ATP-binding protein involved in chromosome partitioning